MVLQDQGTTRPTGTTPIVWNQSGPAGLTGPAGQQGRPPDRKESVMSYPFADRAAGHELDDRE